MMIGLFIQVSEPLLAVIKSCSITILFFFFLFSLISFEVSKTTHGSLLRYRETAKSSDPCRKNLVTALPPSVYKALTVETPSLNLLTGTFTIEIIALL